MNTTRSLASEDSSILKIEFKLDSCFYNVDQGCVGIQKDGYLSGLHEYLQENAFPERPTFRASIRLSSPAKSIEQVIYKCATTTTNRTITGYFYFVEIHVLLYALGGDFEVAAAPPTFNPYQSIDLAATPQRTDMGNQPANATGNQPVNANHPVQAHIHQPINATGNPTVSATGSQPVSAPGIAPGNQPVQAHGNHSVATPGNQSASDLNPPSASRLSNRVNITRVSSNLLDDCSSSNGDEMQVDALNGNKRKK